MHCAFVSICFLLLLTLYWRDVALDIVWWYVGKSLLYLKQLGSIIFIYTIISLGVTFWLWLFYFSNLKKKTTFIRNFPITPIPLC